MQWMTVLQTIVSGRHGIEEPHSLRAPSSTSPAKASELVITTQNLHLGKLDYLAQGQKPLRRPPWQTFLSTRTATVLVPHLAHLDNQMPRRGQGMSQALLKGTGALPQDNLSLPRRCSEVLVAYLASCAAYSDHPNMNERRGWFNAAPMLAALSASSLMM